MTSLAEALPSLFSAPKTSASNSPNAKPTTELTINVVFN